MKLDMDLAKDILHALEERGNECLQPIEIELPGRSPAEVCYHVMLLDEAGLIRATDLSALGHLRWRAIRLTWNGHQLLELARREATWEKAKAVVREKSGGLALGLLESVLAQMARVALGL